MAEPILTDVDRRRLRELVANLYDFLEGPRTRRVFLLNAGLGRFVPAIDLSGSAATVGSDVVQRLEAFGELPERPTYHALGALLAALIGLSDLGEEDKRFAAELVVRYGFVADPAYVTDLTGRYNITEQPVRQPPVVAPPRGTAAPSPPEFDPHVDDEEGLESVINSADNFLDVNLLIGALYCAQAVGRIEAPPGTALGTGFLVGPNLLLTNQHVLKDAGYLDSAVVRFGYYADPSGVAAPGKVSSFEPGFYHSSPAKDLDYALARLTNAPLDDVAAKDALALAPVEELVRQGRHRGYLTLAPRVVIDRERVNILQHPDGDPLKVVLTQNYVVHRTDTRLQYVADTMDGSSGSPVLNRAWEVVALHHSGSPYPPDAVADRVKKAWKGKFRVNEGVPMRAILEDFKTKGLDRFLPRA